MSEPTALDILIAARAKIANPKYWGKGWRQRRPFHTCCAAEAIEETSHIFPERVRAYRALTNAAGIDRGSIVTWNDAPEREHIDVIRAFNLAIATLSLGEPIRAAASARDATPLSADAASPSGGTETVKLWFLRGRNENMSEHLDILVKARALIAERKNWTKDVTARNAIGLSTGVYSEDAASFCLFGALVRAAGLSRQDDVDLVIAAMLATNNLNPYGFPADFNDSHEHSEVLAVVDKTIASVRASRALPSLLEIQASPVPAKEPA